MKKLFLLPLLGVVLLYGCGTPSPDAPIVVDCNADMNCIQENFVTCMPATFTPALESATDFNLKIVGETDNVCSYIVTRSLSGHLVSTECKLPKMFVDADRVHHILGSDTDVGQEDVLQAQLQLDKDYCSKI